MPLISRESKDIAFQEAMKIAEEEVGD